MIGDKQSAQHHHGRDFAGKLEWRGEFLFLNLLACICYRRRHPLLSMGFMINYSPCFFICCSDVVFLNFTGLARLAGHVLILRQYCFKPSNIAFNYFCLIP